MKRSDPKKKQISEGSYTKRDLERTNQLRKGRTLIIRRNGVEQTVIVLDRTASGYTFYDTGTGQILPESVVLSGKFGVRIPGAEEIANITSRHPEVMEYDEFIKRSKDPSFKGIVAPDGKFYAAPVKDNYELRGNKPQHDPGIFVFEASQRNKKLRYPGQDRNELIQSFVKSKRRSVVVNKKVADNLRAKLEEFAKAKEAGHKPSVIREKVKLNRAENALLDVIESYNENREDTNVLKTLDELSGKRKVRFQSQDGINTHVEFVDNTSDFQRRSKRAAAAQLRLEEYEIRKSKKRGVIHSEKFIDKAVSGRLRDANLAGIDSSFLNKIGYRLASPEGAAVSYNLEALKISKSVVQKEAYRQLKAYDSRIATPFVDHILINRLQDVQLAQLEQVPVSAEVGSKRTVFNELDEIRQVRVNLEANRERRRMGSKGIIYPEGDVNMPKRMGVAIAQARANERRYGANFADRLELDRRLKQQFPEGTRVGREINADIRAGKPSRYPKRVTRSTGLMTVVSSLMGAWFYQSMLHNAYRRTTELFNRFIGPGETIDAEQHNSQTRTIQRIINSDFGSGYKGTLGFIKDVIWKGRLNYKRVKALMSKEGRDVVRKKLDKVDSIQDKRTVQRRYFSALLNNILPKRGGLDKLADELGESSKETIELFNKHKYGIAAVGAGAYILTRAASSDYEEYKRSAISERIKNRNIKQYLQYNKTSNEALYSSQTRIETGRPLAGFASPFQMTSHLRLLGNAVNRVVHTISPQKPIEEIVKEFGTRGFKWGESLLKLTRNERSNRLSKLLSGRGKIPNNSNLSAPIGLNESVFEKELQKAVTKVKADTQSSITSQTLANSRQYRITDNIEDIEKSLEKLPSPDVVPSFVGKVKMNIDSAGTERLKSVRKRMDRSREHTIRGMTKLGKNTNTSIESYTRSQSRYMSLNRQKARPEPFDLQGVGFSSKDMPIMDSLKLKPTTYKKKPQMGLGLSGVGDSSIVTIPDIDKQSIKKLITPELNFKDSGPKSVNLSGITTPTKYYKKPPGEALLETVMDRNILKDPYGANKYTRKFRQNLMN